MKKVLIINNALNADDMEYYYNEYHKRMMSVPLHVLVEVEKLGDYETRMVFHSDSIDKAIEDYNADYVIACGRYSDWKFGYNNMEIEFANEYKLFLETSVPTMGICAGHQICALAYKGQIGKMGDTEKVYSELGFKKIKICKQDPIFKNVSDGSEFLMLHRDEVKVLPEEFDILASSQMCQIQAIKHKNKPIYGFQFHPELYSDECYAGHQILKNFLSL
ncbi:MAG: gamma-glutamyl-gamma-aminobutyrate hydrolase family protein [Synergistaceae bacterium]|nr:gamma-glutamyl-gamma-aminobutyrate hydrolase family protein [Synergistaceae bacterium]